MLYNDTITLFNLYASKKEGDIWHPTIIACAHLQYNTAARLHDRGPETADSAILHIRYKKGGGEDIVQNVRPISIEGKAATAKPYASPKDWARLKDKEKAITFTKDKDFFYAGEWHGPAPIRDLDPLYGKRGFFDYMKQNYDYVFLIANVGKYNLIPHFEIGGK